MGRSVYYDDKCGFVPYDDCPQDNLYSESESKHTFSLSEPMTNADRIRSMTDEELATFLDKHLTVVSEYDGNKKHAARLLEWLKQEYKL